ncbi:hypothetical protein K3495_g9849 [Podosphaera aphanis]|nr:hypothetical protein K3495_g9849 [Podosphaera aphanis]
MDHRDSTASQETLKSLLQLEPSPIEFPEYEKEKKPVTESTSSPPPRSLFLGLSGGGGGSTIFYLTRLQKYSSYAFSVFTSFHLANTSLIPLITRSVPLAERYLLLTRPYYQSFPLEPLLITLPIALHVASGIALRLHRRNVNRARYGSAQQPRSTWIQRLSTGMPPLSRTSLTGYILTPMVAGHAIVNRVLPWVYEGGSSGVGLGFVAHAFAKKPVSLTIVYIALIGVASSHFTWGVFRWNGWRQKRWIINTASMALAAAWMAGGLGIVARGGQAEGWIGKGYDALLEHSLL